MAADREIKELHFDVEPQILEGARKGYEVVKTTYGPQSGNVIVEKNWGAATLTHDGISSLRDLYLADPVENQGVQLLKEASSKTNDLGGDGTSATVVLGYHLLRAAYQRLAGGYHAMDLRRELEQAAVWIKAEVERRAVPVEDDAQLIDVATISVGEAALGELIARTLIEVGEDGGVTVEEYPGIAGVEQEIVDGFYWDKGMHSPYMATNDLATEAAYSNVKVLVVEKMISNNADLLPFLERCFKAGVRELVVIGDIQGDALATLIANKIKGALSSVSVAPPVYGDQRPLFLEDIAVLTGATFIHTEEKLEAVSVEALGEAEKVVVTRDATTILGGKGDPAAVRERLQEVKAKLKAEDNEFYRERYGQRIAKLAGKIGLIRVGGATETELRERKFRVDDAVNATRAAREEGIVPGGGKTLLNISLAPGQAPEFVREALREPFRQLQLNAGHNADYRLGKLMESPDEELGYDLRSDEPVNLLAAGIIDPAKVIRLVVEHACSFAANAITTQTAVTFKEKDAPPEPG